MHVYTLVFCGAECKHQLNVRHFVPAGCNIWLKCSYVVSCVQYQTPCSIYAFCVDWHHRDAWLLRTVCTSPFPRLNRTQEETDDRMMIHIQDILSH